MDGPRPGAGTAGELDTRAGLGGFLRTRRARLKPADVGIVDHGRHRRVPGLRREELAQLAGVSTAYYTRLEQGDGSGVSTEVLDAVARALGLDEAEHAHLRDLAGPPRRRPGRPGPRVQQVRATLRTLLHAMDGVPAVVIGRRSDVLAWNPLAAAVFGDFEALPARERNWARLVFLHPAHRDLVVDWPQHASDVVSQLRMDAGAHPDDPRLAALVGELSVRSEEFARLWATHDVRARCHGVQLLHHPLVGELHLRLESFNLADDREQQLVTYHAGPGTPSAASLRLLASWGPDTRPEVAGTARAASGGAGPTGNRPRTLP